MPTVLRRDGFRVAIYPNDHRPAHVHVIGDGKEVAIDLNCLSGPPVERENYGFSRREMGSIKGWLTDALRQVCLEWERIHGRF
jgi:hypothetical protein